MTTGAQAVGSEDPAPARIRIVCRPEGEAPAWVRDAWIGVELDLAYPEPVTTEGFGVLTAPRTLWSYWWRRLTGRIQSFSGYVVDAHDAVLRVEMRNPTAAIWWRTHAGGMVQPGQTFIFDVPACERVGET